MAMISVIFLTQTVLPSIAILDLGIRGNIAMFILKPFTDHLLGVVAAALALWLINLVIPSIIGYYYISKKKILI